MQTLRLSDHKLLWLSLIVNIAPPKPRHVSTTPSTVTYRWDVGETIQQQCEGISRWKLYTDTDDFRSGMQAIVNNKSLSNEARSAAVEQYLLEAGEAAGVLVAAKVGPPMNPNRLGKKLALWFDAACR